MTGLERFRSALSLQPVDRTPLWFMRQAGRYLPEYRALKEKYSFRKMVQTPDLATEVTMQPLQRFPAIDAAILFSDILVIPEAMGMDYDFREEGGIQMAWQFDGEKDLAKLTVEGITESLSYVFDALKLIRAELKGERAMLGFGGSPWTLATYMVEGGSSRDFQKIREMAVRSPEVFEKLLTMITDALIKYFREMTRSGVEAIQIFDSWGSACPGGCYEQWSLKWIKRIIDALGDEASIILFSKGMGAHFDKWEKLGVGVISLDSSIDLTRVLEAPNRNFAVQGNLDPTFLNMSPEVVREATNKIMPASGKPALGHIFNLGHGIMPTARIDSVEAMLDTVDSYRNNLL
ncbi:MAG: uroporphyrinogen decarboxylase [Opitutales bacterium]|nr:uroporphyrinogen decarboxylase [Opitutales bacterium]